MVKELTDAERETVDVNRGLVRAIARTMRGVDSQDDDVFQAGAVGLTRAAQKYDPTLGFAFSTYAAYWIRQAIQNHAWDDRLVRAPRHLAGKAGEAHRYHAHELATRGVATASEDWREGTRPEPWRTDDEPAREDERVARLRRAVSLLPRREAEVVRRRLEGDTLAEIGATMGVTHSRVGQVEREAHARLREMLAGFED